MTGKKNNFEVMVLLKHFSVKHIIFILSLLALACSSEDDPSSDTASTPILPNQGIGEIRFGDPGSKAIATFGPYERTTVLSQPDGAEFVLWFENGLAFRLDKEDIGNLSLQEIVDRSDELVNLDRPIIQMIIMSPFLGETPEGIRIGSPKADVISAYGEPDKLISNAENYESLKMTFSYSFSNDTVRRIDIDD